MAGLTFYFECVILYSEFGPETFCSGSFLPGSDRKRQ